MTDARTDAEKSIDKEVLERVKRGIEFLQERNGRDWVDLIDLNTLDLSHGAHCVLGQVYAHEAGTVMVEDENGDEMLDDGYETGFDWALEYLFSQADAEDEHAGDPSWFGFNDTGRIGFDRLQDAWVREITKRQRPIFTT